MTKDWFDINEDSTMVNPNTSFYCYLTEKEIQDLDSIKTKNIIFKRSSNRSSIIKKIVLNTYLYLNNMDRGFEDDLNKLLNKPYFKNLDFNFTKKLSSGGKEYELIQELVRIQVLKCMGQKINLEDNLIKVQFRLAKDDYDLMRVFAGNRNINISDFISGYLKYFLSMPLNIRQYILRYPDLLKLERCIKDNRFVIIGDKKLKAIKIDNKKHSLATLVCLDSNSNIVLKTLFSILDVMETDEYYSLTSYEKELIKLYDGLDEIEISFVVVNETKDITRLLENNDPVILSKKADGIKQIINIRYSSGIIQLLKDSEKNGDIKYLCFSKNYNDFIKTLENK